MGRRCMNSLGKETHARFLLQLLFTNENELFTNENEMINPTDARGCACLSFTVWHMCMVL
jgi:hypothetical protein